jgi:hypothetical protein
MLLAGISFFAFVLKLLNFIRAEAGISFFAFVLKLLNFIRAEGIGA